MKWREGGLGAALLPNTIKSLSVVGLCKHYKIPLESSLRNDPPGSFCDPLEYSSATEVWVMSTSV